MKRRATKELTASPSKMLRKDTNNAIQLPMHIEDAAPSPMMTNMHYIYSQVSPELMSSTRQPVYTSPLKKNGFSRTDVRQADLDGARAKTMLSAHNMTQSLYFHDNDWISDVERKKSDTDRYNVEIIVKEVPSTNYWLEIIGSKAYRSVFRELRKHEMVASTKLFATRTLLLQENAEEKAYVGSIMKEGYSNLYKYFATSNPDIVSQEDDYIVGAKSTKGYRLTLLPEDVRKYVIRGCILRILCGDDDIHPLNIIIKNDGKSIKMIDFEMFGRLYAKDSKQFANLLFWLLIYHHKVELIDMRFIESVHKEIAYVLRYQEGVISSIESSINDAVQGLGSDPLIAGMMPDAMIRGVFDMNTCNTKNKHYPVNGLRTVISRREDVASLLIETLKNNFTFLTTLNNKLSSHLYKDRLISDLTKQQSVAKTSIIEFLEQQKAAASNLQQQEHTDKRIIERKVSKIALKEGSSEDSLYHLERLDCEAQKDATSTVDFNSTSQRKYISFAERIEQANTTDTGTEVFCF